jgi:hypothetical protein
MMLRGSIERFDLGSVLQFLAQSDATGVLEIRDFEEHGYIYLVKGHLEAISLPLTDDRLGVFLLKRGLLAENQLTKVLMEEAAGRDGQDARKPLGQRLAEQGFVSETIIRQAIHRLTLTRMFEIAHWRSGIFSYDEPEQMPRFQISIGGDVQELLLQTQIRIDHGEKPRKLVAARQEDSLCRGCTVTDCTAAIRLKYRKKDLCLWRKMSGAPEMRLDRRLDTRPDGSKTPADEAETAVAVPGQRRQF